MGWFYDGLARASLNKSVNPSAKHIAASFPEGSISAYNKSWIEIL